MDKYQEIIDFLNTAIGSNHYQIVRDKLMFNIAVNGTIVSTCLAYGMLANKKNPKCLTGWASGPYARKGWGFMIDFDPNDGFNKENDATV